VPPVGLPQVADATSMTSTAASGELLMLIRIPTMVVVPSLLRVCTP